MRMWYNQMIGGIITMPVCAGFLAGLLAVLLAGLMILWFSSVFNRAGGKIPEKVITKFSIETLSIGIGIELKGDFEWTETTEAYYDALMKGEISLAAIKTAEDYLSRLHPMMRGNLTQLAILCGFDMSREGVVGIDNVRMNYLQAAARGFRLGLTMSGGLGLGFYNPEAQ